MKTLLVVGVLYLFSGAWCAWQPELASAYLGFSLTGSLANSEFFSVYGGLQIGLAVALLCSARIPLYVEASLFFAMLFSGILCLFRAASLALYGLETGLLLMLLLEAAIAISLLFAWQSSRKTHH